MATGAEPVPEQPEVRTYSSAILDFALAAAATDVWTITGAAGVVVRVLRMGFSGESTAGTLQDIQLVKRSTGNIAGTATATAIIPHDPNDGAGAATVRAYTANPGTLGTILGPIRAWKVLTPTAAPPSAGGGLIEGQIDYAVLAKAPILRGTGHVLAVSFNGAVSAGTRLAAWVEWTEATF